MRTRQRGGGLRRRRGDGAGGHGGVRQCTERISRLSDGRVFEREGTRTIPEREVKASFGPVSISPVGAVQREYGVYEDREGNVLLIPRDEIGVA